jgi:hypothetical protein
MYYIIKDAGHSKFKADEVLTQEIEILKTLGFDLTHYSFYEEVVINLKTLFY